MRLRFILFLSIFLISPVVMGAEAVRHGFIDLQNHNFKKDGSVELRGDWEFYMGKLISKGEFNTYKAEENFRYISVPGSWVNLPEKGKAFSNNNCATYRLRLRLPVCSEPYVIRFHEINSAYRITVNGVLLKEAGRVSEKNEEVKSVEEQAFVAFNAKEPDNEIVVEVANRGDYHAGLVGFVDLGTYSEAVTSYTMDFSFGFFLFGCLVMMGLFHLGIFSLRREDRSSLYFGIFTLIIAVRTSVTGEKFFYTVFHEVPWELGVRIEFLTVMSAAFFVLYIYDLYRDYFRKLYLNIFIWVSVIMVIITVFTPPSFFMGLHKIYHASILLIALYIFKIIFSALKNDSRGSVIMVSAFIVVIIASVNDMLTYWLLVDSTYILPVGLLIFIFLQSVLMSLRNLESHKSVKKLTEKLNSNLDHIFQLRERTESIENELVMARKIQRQLIPHDSPSVNLNALYKPMDLVGGDFYDFINFRDSNEIGIFISDVSGHGIAAAFVTSMIKSLILESGSFRKNPAMLMKHLNGILFNNTGGNFITAFYCIYNSQSRSMVYSNAGHDHPFIINDYDVEVLSGGKSVPLAIFSNEELSKYNKEYVNDEISFEEGSKFLLFTDGLVENMGSCKITREMEDKNFRSYLISTSYLSSKRYIDNLYEKLIDCNGSDKFDDDICIICLDV